MEILEVHLKNFGKFRDQRITFHSGVNAVYGENETGKSTLFAFIRGMLFGIEKARGRASWKDSYQILKPWENSGCFAGSMEFRMGEKIFYLERSFSRTDKRIRLVCETDGEELDAEHGDLEGLLDGLGERAVCNTLFLGSETGKTDQTLAAEIQNYMVNARSGGGTEVNVAQAMERLKKEQKRLERERKQMLEEETVQAREIQMRMDYARQEAEELLREETACREELETFRESQRRWQEEPELEFPGRAEAAGRRRLWKTGEILVTLAAVMAMGASVLFPDWKVWTASVAVIGVSCFLVRWFAGREQAEKTQLREQEMQWREQQLQEMLRRQKQREQQQRAQAPKRDKLLANLEWLSSARREKETQFSGLQEEYEGLKKKGKEREQIETRIAAVSLAMETLGDVTSEICKEYGERLNQRVSEIFCQITKGRYRRIFVDENLEVKIYENRRVLNLWQVSRGTMEQIWFAIRMAAGELINEGEPFPILLDDAFLTYDDARLEETLRWLSSCGRQVILLSCQKREQEILEKISASPAAGGDADLF